MRRLLALASAIVFIDAMFFAAIVPLLPSYVEDFDLTKTGAGILAAAYPAGTLLGSLPGGWVAARLGVRATVVIGLTLLITSSIAFAFANSIVVLDVARFVQGLGSAASWAGALEATMSPYFGRLSDRHGRVLPCLVGLAASGVAMALLPWPEATAALVAIVILTGPSIGILWTPSMAMISDGADDIGLDQGYAVALINLAWSTGQTVGSAGGARLGEAYGDALPYLGLAAACALTLAAVSRPRAAAVLAGS